ncbi:MAG: family 10 glycosylhydrolase [Flavipsychrobacter sp.]|nr:family 10 glycosylhydrolase [Flavipsychrobacter sp.]
MHRFLFLLLTACLVQLSVNARTPKREFRAAWIATVANIDWPSKPGLPAAEQQQQFINRLDELKEMGCNAVIVQVRPSSDALYDSKHEPWSRYLTGRQGQAPFPYYDPLEFMIEETHKRCMEFHAWFNPFRALVDSKKNPNPPGHITRTHPEWIISYGGKSYIDPGTPEAREYVIKVIMDVVKRYDIDAVHIDDYFYPYRIAGQEFGDSRSWSRCGGDFRDRGDWRRNNVNVFISNLNSSIKNTKSYVKFGISPFGVWRNASKDPKGSKTNGGQTCYDDLYSDVILWMEKGWIDYLLPQLYWEHGHRAAPFDVLLPWWEEHSYGRHIYNGLGVYRMVAPVKAPWHSPNEILWQIRDIRKVSATPGFVFYSASSFNKIPGALKDSLRYKYNRYPAIPPAMPWLDKKAPSAPTLKVNVKNGNAILRWVPNDEEPGLRYAVYRFVNNEEIDLERGDKLVSLQRGIEYTDVDAGKYTSCTYIVTALDRTWNESRPSNEVSLDRQ